MRGTETWRPLHAGAFALMLATLGLYSAVALLIDRPGARLPAILVQFIVYGLVAVAQGPSIGVTLLLLICLSIELCMVASAVKG